MFMLKTKHEAALDRAQAANDYLTSVAAGLRADNAALRQTNYTLDRAAAKYKSERDSYRDRLDKALEELAPLKARKDRQVQNLRDANARRAEVARQREIVG